MKGKANIYLVYCISGEVKKHNLTAIRATSLPIYDFSILYTTLPHNLIEEKLKDLIEWSFQAEGSPYHACYERNAFFTSEHQTRYKFRSCQNMCEK